MDIREKRKWDHLEYSLLKPSGPLSTGFCNVHLVHQALSCYNLSEIDCSLNLLGKKLQFPLIINAMTGGAKGLDKINKNFAIAARECGIALAVGSQTAAIKNKETRNTFEIVRKENPQGLILANLSALVSYEFAQEAVEMIEADGLQLHLNLAQELAMLEGDRNFSRLLENILIIKEKIPVPIIIKEVGFGLSLETVKRLNQSGINYFDIGGAGGTNFATIERSRNNDFTNPDLIEWGIPTAISLLETLSVSDEIEVYATGGIKTATDILKSLVLGAKAVGIASPILKIAYKNNAKDVIYYLDNLFRHVKELMLLTGAKDLANIKKCPLIITGFVKDWLESRGINSLN